MNEMNIIVKSAALKEGDWIPVKHSARGEDLSPPLELDDISEKARSIAITMDDASHPIF